MHPTASPTSDEEQLLRIARRRAQERGARHAGDLTPHETAALLRDRAITLVDVRSEDEWRQAGRVPGTTRIEWPVVDAPGPRQRFLAGLAALRTGGRPLVVLCRSGVRSECAARAAAEAGIDAVYNMLEGFEGAADASGRRGHVNGWMHARLPWIGHETVTA